MEYNWIKLPLYDSWDFKYNVGILNKSIDFRFYYSDRTKQWSYEVAYAGGDYIIRGATLLPYKPMLEYAIEGVSGFMWMEPISEEINETVIHPDQIYKYYNLYFIYWDDV